jgi:hypothetical protein
MVYIQNTLHLLRRSSIDFLCQKNPPGFAELSWLQKQRLNGRALTAFCCTFSALRLLLCIIVWSLSTQLLIWRLDVREGPGVLLVSFAAVWAWPWLSRSRRWHIALLLRRGWPDAGWNA